MNEITRRRFLATTALSFAATRLPAQNSANSRITLDVSGEAAGPHMPADFVGLSYEVRQLADPSFFSAANIGLIEQFKALSPHGVLRLGGNTSEFAWFKPTPSTPEPPHPPTREVEGEPKADYYAVTAEAVRNLAAFLKATGWTCLYGINMGTNTPERAAEEAAFAAKTLGEGLQYFQIGNEADLYNRHLRDPKTWGPATYLNEWLAVAHAVTARVPEAKFGIPDVAADIDWLTEIASRWSSIQHPPHVTRLTHHYYFGGPATNPEVNIPNLLKPATMQKVQKTADIATAAAQKMDVRVRMTEGNTCYRGGKPGVSDVFAAALWAADYSLLLASKGYTGVNLHGGTGKIIASGLGGFLPGDVLLQQQGATQEQIASHPHPFYSPIATQDFHHFTMEPVAYGLKFAGSFSGSTFLKTDLSAKLQATGVNATAYAAKLPNNRASVIILNKDADKNLELTVNFGATGTGAVAIETLHAPALDSREAHLTPAAEHGRLKEGKYEVTVPRSSGLRLTLI
ncbi:hypothetical protein DYQ86_08140 [Acidobacteria bacterium AB60]|nr:hypothetical protein DYQ86_08140 [Acidobacteria bacterium AB60]